MGDVMRRVWRLLFHSTHIFNGRPKFWRCIDLSKDDEHVKLVNNRYYQKKEKEGEKEKKRKEKKIID